MDLIENILKPAGSLIVSATLFFTPVSIQSSTQFEKNELNIIMQKKYILPTIIGSTPASNNSYLFPIPTPTPTPTPTPPPTPTPTVTPTFIQTPSPTNTPKQLPQSSSDLDSWFTKYSQLYSIDKNTLKKIAFCESGLNPQAKNGIYGGLYQYSEQTWKTTRKSMSADDNPDLRFSAEESIRTSAFKISQQGISAWPNCGTR
jgi:hypothetical protein